MNAPYLQAQLPRGANHEPVSRRVVDLAVAIPLLILSLPLLLLVAAASSLTYRTQPLFRHERVGLDGRRFAFIKLRTLPPTVEAYAAKYELESLRIPAFMQLVRRLHLDELPQLLLVVKGTMSLVGPRPEMPNLHELFSPRDAAQRTSVRPGITGLWQISDECMALIAETPQYDRFYVEHRSWRLDFWIMLMTARKMIGLRTVTIEEVPRWTRSKYAPLPVLVGTTSPD